MKKHKFECECDGTCNANDPITDKTSIDELMDRLIEQIKNVNQVSVYLEMRMISEYMMKKIDDMKKTLDNLSPSW